jgi:2Fe-2S ferredoxin
VPQVIFILPDKSVRHVDAPVGEALLDVALGEGISGITGDCGGMLTCGTCHGYVGEDFLASLPPPSDDEQAMIDDGVADPRPNSRLCCQIMMAPELAGMTITVPRQF